MQPLGSKDLQGATRMFPSRQVYAAMIVVFAA